MDDKTKTFLNNHRTSVMSVLQDSGIVHAATMHFAADPEKELFFFMTGRETIKCQSLQDGKPRKAAVVIGFNEEEMATFQAEGEVSLLTEENKDLGWKTYTNKYPNRAKGKDDPGVVILEFRPSWGRFSDYGKGAPVEVLLKK